MAPLSAPLPLTLGTIRCDKVRGTRVRHGYDDARAGVRSQAGASSEPSERCWLRAVECVAHAGADCLGVAQRVKRRAHRGRLRGASLLEELGAVAQLLAQVSVGLLKLAHARARNKRLLERLVEPCSALGTLSFGTVPLAVERGTASALLLDELVDGVARASPESAPTRANRC